ncbi:MAG: hypothetical protein JSS74_12025 [Actinobacteria bacterium]|nr:hypothetical protein [Actinomycetota bacterium]
MRQSLRIGGSGAIDRLMIMRLITSIGLSLLLILGVAATSHGEAGTSATSAVASSSAVASADDLDAEVVRDQIPVIGGSEGSNLLLSGALCTLGVLCGLAVAILLLRMLWRPQSLILRATDLRDVFAMVASTASPRLTRVSLTQLGLSRT